MSLIQKLGASIREHQLIARGDTLVVGVSGGPDSLTLLHALKILAPEFDLKLYVAHLNHQLRGEASDADEQFVSQLARAWGLQLASARWDVRAYAAENGLSIEHAARNLRYQFLMGVANQVHAKAIAVAHNADDQVETILLHFLRGAGLSGLRGMAFKSELQIADGRWQDDSSSTVTRRPSLALIRPLLDITRAEIEAYCLENNLQPRTDETNLDTTILRNRLRHEVIPYLEKINPNLRAVLRDSARSIADDYDYVHQNVLGIFDRMAGPLDDGFIFDRKWFRALPVNLQRGVLREAVSRLRRLKNIGYHHIENARRVAAEKDAGAEATLPQGLLLVVGYDDFMIGEHLPLPDTPLLLHGKEIVLKVGDEILLEESDWGVRVSESGNAESGRWSVLFDAERISGNLVLRTRRAGERFAPRGMKGKHKSLHEFMIDEKIPRHLREFIPILADDEKILWVVGYRADERARVTDATKNILRLEFFKNLE
ncbi:MAG: tRNA lysidine(34) synthetase TilS [Chloroflexota bacterium]|nr:MAG: tRNA lysidine(34) synthetase TilS [Chloroflexota bacterium]